MPFWNPKNQRFLRKRGLCKAKVSKKGVFFQCGEHNVVTQTAHEWGVLGFTLSKRLNFIWISYVHAFTLHSFQSSSSFLVFNLQAVVSFITLQVEF